MVQIYKRVFVADEYSCVCGDNNIAVIHACKFPCHKKAVGYSGSLPKTHPHYLILEKENDLFLNMIDPEAPFFFEDTFKEFLNFSTKHYNNGQKILIHCNKGESRSPSLALFFLSKKLNVINSTSFEKARADFVKIYPKYKPGKGIRLYLSKNWKILN